MKERKHRPRAKRESRKEWLSSAPESTNNAFEISWTLLTLKKPNCKHPTPDMVE
jgi:hypothetical protein